MKILDSKGLVKLVVVCGVHGDEQFGRRVFDRYRDRLGDLQGLRLILANEEALAMNNRGVEGDLNRSFPGDSTGDHEQRLAARLMPYLLGADIVLDIHTTTSDLVMTPVVANLSDNVKRVINLTSTGEVVMMPLEIVSQALIGNVPAGVSLDFNTVYAREPHAMEDVDSVITGLLSGNGAERRSRKVFEISGYIPLETRLPTSVRNFRKPRGMGFYPFLPNGKSYATHRGFAANKMRRINI